MVEKKAFLTPEEHAKIVEEVEKKVGYKICGYVWEDKNGFHVCRIRAGAGTKHLGVGYCKKHDPNSAVPVPTYKDDINPERFSLWEAIERYEKESNWASLKREIATARALLEDLSHRATDERTMAAILKTIDTIGNVVEKQVKIEERNSISPEEMKFFMLQVKRVIERDVEDIELKNRIFRDLQEIPVKLSPEERERLLKKIEREER